MAETFKYVLTRVCLRSGQLTLPHMMLDLFPVSGTVIVLDSENNREYELSFPSRRNVTGLGMYFREQQLQVNDELRFRQLQDRRFEISVVPRPRKPDFENPGHVTTLLDNFYKAGVASSEAEIRATFAGITDGFDLADALAKDGRLAFADGRWQPIESVRGEVLVADELAEEPEGELTEPPITGQVTSHPKGLAYPGDAGLNSEQTSGDLSMQNRARFLFLDFGYSVEGIGQGQLLVQADLGRRKYQVFVHLLPPNERLDWAALLSRRRESGATYLCVVGGEKDLERLHAPAELARASLWPWVGLEHAQELSRLTSLNPLDLEPFLERDGLLGRGIKRLEQSVEKRIDEIRAVSGILTRLAAMRAPTVFLLEDIVDVSLPRHQLLGLLEHLEKAPFHLVSRVDNGEFCLHSPVHDALHRLSDYLLALRGRFPSGQGEKIVEVGDHNEAAESLEVSQNPEK
jgi:hypothetical protein